jgi:sulfonate transport system substrate-binding protein
MRAPMGFRRGMAAIALALLLSLQGCGGGHNAASAPILKVGDQNKALQIPISLAGQTKNLPPVEWTTFTDGPHMNAAFLAQALDIGLMGDTPALLAGAARADVVVLAAARIPGNGYIRIVTRPGSAIRTLADLRGQRVAYTRGTAGHGYLLLGLETVGLRQRDVTLVDIPGVSITGALGSGGADAAVTGGSALVSYLKGHPTAHAIDVPLPFYCVILASRKSLADPAKREAIRRFIAADARASPWLGHNVDAWAQEYFGRAQHQSPALIKELAKSQGPDMSRFGIADDAVIAQFRNEARLLSEAGVIPSAAVVDQLFDPKVTAEFNRVIQEAK